MRGEVLLFLWAAATGAFFLLLYDFLRAMRRVFPCAVFVTGCLEFLFWMFSAFTIFFLMDARNRGVVRLFVFLGIAIGVWLNFRTIHRLVLLIWMTFLLFPVKLVKKVRKRLLFLRKRCKISMYKFAKSGKVGENRF